MGIPLISYIQNLLTPFFPLRRIDDIKQSNKLVDRLTIPNHIKQFVFAIPEPQSNSIVYILVTQNLSLQSALDAEHLIKEVHPELVVAQVDPPTLIDIHSEEKYQSIPTSALGVLLGSFVDRINKDKYESVAGNLVLKEIFGVGFYGHFLAAKKAAKEVGSTVLLLESPFVSLSQGNVDASDEDGEGNKNKNKNMFQALGGMLSSNLAPQNVASSSRRLLFSNDLHSKTMRPFVLALSQLNFKPGSGSVSEVTSAEDCQIVRDYEVPSFAQSVYPLLMDLHDVFTNLPSVRRALVNVQKMLCDVEKGDTIDSKILSEVQAFRIAVESMRTGFNNVARSPIDKMVKQSNSKCEFSELPIEDKSSALFARAIRSQTKQFKSIVAIMDATSLHELRKHWNTPLPPEVEDLIEHFFTEYEEEGEVSPDGNKGKKKRIASKPVVAVGAGATAVIGVSSLSKAVPASTLMKVVTYQVPASLKLGLIHTQKGLAVVLSKILGSSKLVGPGLASSGVKSTPVIKAAASAERIRTVAHSIIAAAERTSLSAVRTAFYEIMRKRRVQPIRSMPWVTFGCSIATCSGLLAYGDGIEFAAESIPVAPTIASLGRGLQSLHQASQAVRQSNGTEIKESIQSLMYSLKNQKQLVKKDWADPNSKDSKGSVPLWEAGKYDKVIRLLINHGANLFSGNMVEFACSAILRNNRSRWFFMEQIQCYLISRVFLHLIVIDMENKNEEIIQVLLDQGADGLLFLFTNKRETSYREILQNHN